MSTWLELRQEILTLLDINPNATTASDMRVAVDYSMKHVRDRLYSMRPPRSLVVSSDTVALASTDELIKLSGVAEANKPTFDVDDCRKILALTVEGEEWDFLSWSSWIALNHVTMGDQRARYNWTIDYQNYIYLNSAPATGETWDVVLHYMKEPPTIADGDSPDLDEEFEELLVLGTVLRFPNRFRSEERLALYGGFKGEYNELLKEYKRQQTTLRSNWRIKPRYRRPNRSTVFWGDGETF